ncbi:MAG: FxLYD domain-containing protein [Bryobacteraceae bacterium]|jgi:hypothetical protein
MASRFRKYLESIVYARMSAGKPKAESKRMRLLGPLRGPVGRWLSGGGRQDPLYLSNRTFSQKLVGWAKVGVPLLVVVVAVVIAFRMHRRVDKPAELLSPAEVAAKMLPELNKPIHVDTNTDIEVLEAYVDHDAGDRLVGKFRNATDHAIQTGEVDFTLTGVNGTQVGAVSVKLNKLAAGETVPFAQPISEKAAAFALVRDVHTQ